MKNYIDANKLKDEIERRRDTACFTHYELMCAAQKGYEQAEKDLVLTWKDMQKIYEIICGIDAELSALPYGLGFQEYWEEVLRRFNKAKEETK